MMRLFYKINLTSESDTADIVSFAFCDDRGRRLYAECNDYAEEKVDPFCQKHIIEELYGAAGMKKLTPNLSKLAGLHGSLEYCRGKLAEMISGYRYIEFVGFSSYPEVQALLWLIDWESEKRHINIIQISNEFFDRYSDMLDGVHENLPPYNALKYAEIIKHISRKHERAKSHR